MKSEIGSRKYILDREVKNHYRKKASHQGDFENSWETSQPVENICENPDGKHFEFNKV